MKVLHIGRMTIQGDEEIAAFQARMAALFERTAR